MYVWYVHRRFLHTRSVFCTTGGIRIKTSKGQARAQETAEEKEVRLASQGTRDSR